MNGGHITPVHPGEVLKDELEETGISQPALAKHIGVLPEIISEICRVKIIYLFQAYEIQTGQENPTLENMRKY